MKKKQPHDALASCGCLPLKKLLYQGSPGAALAQIKIDGKNFDTEICETTLCNWIYRGDIFMNVTGEDLLYKGDHRKPEDRDRQKRARPAKGDTIEQRPEEIKEALT